MSGSALETAGPLAHCPGSDELEKPAMSQDKPAAPGTEPEAPPAEPQVYIPKPPSPTDTKEISEQQALITDEWTGEEPRDRG